MHAWKNKEWDTNFRYNNEAENTRNKEFKSAKLRNDNVLITDEENFRGTILIRTFTGDII